MRTQRQHKFTYLMPVLDKFSFGEAYYHTIKDNSTEISIRALKVILLLDATIKVKSYPFHLKNVPYIRFLCYDALIKGTKELISKGYLDRINRSTYKLNDKGAELVKLFWWRHSRLFANFVNEKSV